MSGRQKKLGIDVVVFNQGTEFVGAEFVDEVFNCT